MGMIQCCPTRSIVLLRTPYSYFHSLLTLSSAIYTMYFLSSFILLCCIMKFEFEGLSVHMWGRETSPIHTVDQSQPRNGSRGTQNNGIIRGVTPETTALPIGSKASRSKCRKSVCSCLFLFVFGSGEAAVHLTPHVQRVRGILKRGRTLFLLAGLSLLLIPLSFLHTYHVFRTTAFELCRQPAGSSWLGPPEDPGQEPR